MDAPEVCRLTLQAWRWVEDISPHPRSYPAGERRHHGLEGWTCPRMPYLSTEASAVAALSANRRGYRIQGVVKINGTLSRRRVTLVSRGNFIVVEQAWSDAETGEYVFEYIDNGDYMVICDDYGQTYNAAVADWVEPTLMP